MPELPEVETVIRILRDKIEGLTIIKAKINLAKLLKSSGTINAFETDITGRTIETIKRIGKNIIFNLDDKVLISHLRMTGRWYVYKNSEIHDPKHDLAYFELSNKTILVFNDSRRFGTFHYQNKSEYEHINPIVKVGPEPLNDAVDGEYLFNKMSKSNRYIKTLLLDQTIVSGIGNIYADEILFLSNISPLKKGSDILLDDYQKIAKNSQKILNHAIKLGGSTIDSYYPEQGVSGQFQTKLQVHTRAGKKCYVCQTKINKIKVNGRGTYYCKTCQN